MHVLVFKVFPANFRMSDYYTGIYKLLVELSSNSTYSFLKAVVSSYLPSRQGYKLYLLASCSGVIVV